MNKLRRGNITGFIVFIVFIVILLVRVRVGIDFSDESYYATFIHDWLIGGIEQSLLLTIHQTAAFIIYPLAWLYTKTMGSMEGLFLFLRHLFVLGSILAAGSWVIFLKKAKYDDFTSWGSGIIILAFIPFGLPAPSYNTLGCQLLTIALATFGCAAFNKSTHFKSTFWMLFSACAWTLAIIAYPTLMLAMAFFVVMLLVLRDRILKNYMRYVFLLLITGLAGWLIVFYFLSIERIYQSIIYLSVINSVSGFSEKIHFIMMLFKNNGFFAFLFVSALSFGIVRNCLPERLKTICMSLIVFPLLFITPVLYQHAHDVITLCAFMGLGLITGLAFKREQENHVFSMIFAVSFMSSLIIACTATHSIYNFCIGAIPAAMVSIISRPSGSGKYIRLFLMSEVLVIVLSTSLFSFYGEMPSNFFAKRQYISDGFFSGLWVQPDDANLLMLVEKNMLPLTSSQTAIAVLGRYPGISLVLPATLKMRTAFPLVSSIPQKGLDMTHDFYAQIKNRPDIVLIYEDSYFTPINPMEPNFSEWYTLIKMIKTPSGKLSIYKPVVTR